MLACRLEPSHQIQAGKTGTGGGDGSREPWLLLTDEAQQLQRDAPNCSDSYSRPVAPDTELTAGSKRVCKDNGIARRRAAALPRERRRRANPLSWRRRRRADPLPTPCPWHGAVSRRRDSCGSWHFGGHFSGCCVRERRWQYKHEHRASSSSVSSNLSVRPARQAHRAPSREAPRKFGPRALLHECQEARQHLGTLRASKHAL
mmetsp:Transcript_134843/g.252155  ORF Transcript_134843/g.252155 Transcript_134843/m.252155 type:complete len:203 (+) Transcript_134843:538-1146(+)